MPTTRTLRQLTVWLHVLTSVGWMALAAVMAVSLALYRGDPTPFASVPVLLVVLAHRTWMLRRAPAVGQPRPVTP